MENTAQTTLAPGHIFRAGGDKYETAIADGKGGFLRAGFYFHSFGRELYGPFASEAQAALIRSMLNARPRLCEQELIGGEFAALRALRRKGYVAPVGVYLTDAGRAAFEQTPGAL